MENIKHPKAKDVLKVIKNFEKLPAHIREIKDNVNMEVADVKDVFGKCGTVLCHAGWYTVVSCIKLPFISLNYQDGASKMAKQLGFSRYPDLLKWANSNPEIWGNNRGEYMFSHPSAFTGKAFWSSVLSIQDIIDHWKGVYQRLYDLENPKPVVTEVYPDITKDLASLPIEEKPDIIVKVKEEAIF